MPNASKAYEAIALQTASPRELEANLLLQAATRLQAATETPTGGKTKLDEALGFNRKLWLLLLASVTRPDNPLPESIRQNVANLGLFVMNQTMTTIRDPKPEQLSPLIAINRELAAGLMGRA